MRQRLSAVVALGACAALCGPSASAQGDSRPGVDVKTSYVGLYGHAQNSCWSVAFAGPDRRVADLMAAAEARFEKPSAVAMAAAQRKVVEVYTWPDSTLECGNEIPQTIVVRDSTDSTTIGKVPLVVKTSTRANAFGAAKMFGEGSATLTMAAFRALFEGVRIVYLITSDGRRGGWHVGKEMRAVDDAASWQRAQMDERRQRLVDRLEGVCSSAAALPNPRWLTLDVISNAMDPPTDGLARAVAQPYVPCLERLAAVNDETGKSAAKLLAKLRANP